MTIFTGSTANDLANAETGALVGFTGGTIADLQDLVGDSFLGGGLDDEVVAGGGNDTVSGGAGDDRLDGGNGS